MARKIVNGELVDMGADEAAAFEAERAPSLPQAKRALRDVITQRRRQAERAGFTFQTKRFDSSDPARISLLANRARAAIAESATLRVTFAAEDDSLTQFNANELVAFERACADHYVACSDNAKALRQAVNAAADVAAVAAIDIESGWPA